MSVRSEAAVLCDQAVSGDIGARDLSPSGRPGPGENDVPITALRQGNDMTCMINILTKDHHGPDQRRRRKAPVAAAVRCRFPRPSCQGRACRGLKPSVMICWLFACSPINKAAADSVAENPTVGQHVRRQHQTMSHEPASPANRGGQADDDREEMLAPRTTRRNFIAGASAIALTGGCSRVGPDCT